MALKPQQVKRIGLSHKRIEKIIDETLSTQTDLTFTADTINFSIALTASIPDSELIILSEQYIKAGWEDFLIVYGGVVDRLHLYTITLTYTGIGTVSPI